MNTQQSLHSFHVPVMGIGFTVDTPIKVAHYGISSVMSLVDDILVEKMREFYSQKLNLPFAPITEKNSSDHRAERITAYLNMVDKIVHDKFESVKRSIHDTGEEVQKYVDMLPDLSAVKKQFQELIAKNTVKEDIAAWIDKHLYPGSIDVNIMTKLDKENYRGDEKLPNEFNDAHAALRGFAKSTLRSCIVFSAGMNPRLYGYIEKFDDFYPDANGDIKKKIILKVSDYRSAIIQGKFLAKKGLWVSEYRIESGLNCGGHAFATDGYLMGPILEEFKKNRQELITTIHGIVTDALQAKNRFVPTAPLPIKITAQGGVGTAAEHNFLLKYYGLDSIGWGSPFLLCPEVTNVDSHTLGLLCKAKEEDLYLSNISPLGVPFNSLRGNTKDIEKQGYIDKGRPGSACPKKYIQLNTEFGERAICRASRQYQNLRINLLDEKGLSEEERQKEFDAIVDKSCICVGLGTSALIVNNLNTRVEGPGVSVCPGPNIAYFDRVVSLRTMIDHIYGRTSIVNETIRPNLFIKELQLYVDYLKNMIDETPKPFTDKQMKYYQLFQQNLDEGIAYYKQLYADFEEKVAVLKNDVLQELDQIRQELHEPAMTIA
ncbi:MAG: hypothetical protein WCX28_00225 [Bacteriovoracaceae bacterium]|nr:hypothetical protein [Bacteroidota bacterium]